MAIDYFQNFLGNSSPTFDVDLSNVDCLAITKDQALNLEAPVTALQIHNTLKNMKMKKARGLDGFNVDFFMAT